MMCTSYFKAKVTGLQEDLQWVAAAILQVSQCMFNLPCASSMSKTKEMVTGNFQSPVGQKDTCNTQI
jgi:hypothetical protein